MTVTISDHVYKRLVQISDHQGRSLSNLAAFLLECSVSGVEIDRESSLQPLPVLHRQLSGRFDANAGAKAE